MAVLISGSSGVLEFEFTSTDIIKYGIEFIDIPSNFTTLFQREGADFLEIPVAEGFTLKIFPSDVGGDFTGATVRDLRTYIKSL